MHRWLRQWLLTVSLVATPPAAASGNDQLPAWSRLRFEHRGFAMSAVLEIARDDVGVAEMPVTVPVTGALDPSGKTVSRLEVDSRFRFSPLFRRHRNAVLWFDPSSHNALLGTRETTGMGEGYRLSRYAATGVDIARASPASHAERKAMPATWTQVARSFVAYGTAREHCTVVSEPMALLLMDPTSLPDGICVYSKQRLLRPVFSAPVEEALAVDLQIHGVDGNTTHLGRVQARRYTLRLEPLEHSARSGEEEAFLGLDGEITLHVDAETATPLGLQGNAALLGRVDLRLHGLWPVQH